MNATGLFTFHLEGPPRLQFLALDHSAGFQLQDGDPVHGKSVNVWTDSAHASRIERAVAAFNSAMEGGEE